MWKAREFRKFDNSVQLGNVKLALRRLRRFAREGSAEELNLEATIEGTARKGYLDIAIRPERRNAVKLLLLLDVGGSMDPYVGGLRGTLLSCLGRVQAPRVLLLPQLCL